MRKSLVDTEKIILSPLHLRLGLLKQFVKAWMEMEIVLIA
jgi:hypothetical protein